jgi:hypothetical protein
MPDFGHERRDVSPINSILFLQLFHVSKRQCQAVHSDESFLLSRQRRRLDHVRSFQRNKLRS